MSQSTVLLVEDELLLREGVQEVLEVHGYKVMVAGDGAEALALLGRTPVNLIISDLVMPNMNGVDFVQRVRQQFPQLPIIVASGSPGAVMKRLGIDSIQVPGATACIMKPFKSAELLALVKQVLLTAA
jgi:CheY-like chemotaxis protein